MRFSIALILLLPGFTFAQPDAAQKKATIKWVTDLEAPGGGFYLAPQDPKIDTKPVPSLRATNSALRALKYLGAEIPIKDKHAAFILKCYDPKTGGFADAPDGKPDVATTSVGVMAAAELSIPHEKFAKAMDYIKENAKSFEYVRIGAAAVEAWGVKDCPFDLKPWYEIGRKHLVDPNGSDLDMKDGGARELGAVVAMHLRLNEVILNQRTAGMICDGQRNDGGWGKKGEKTSDIESTYRVMRALMLISEKPKDVKKLREFLASHGNKDGGYTAKPGDKSNMSGAYYAAIITHWLDEMEAKK